jgi:hypothetical protein
MHPIRHGNDGKSSYRIFAVQIENTTLYWANKGKTEADFQKDMHDFVGSYKNLDPQTLEHMFNKHMYDRKYIPVSSLVCDTFKARILHTKSRLIPTGD